MRGLQLPTECANVCWRAGMYRLVCCLLFRNFVRMFARTLCRHDSVRSYLRCVVLQATELFDSFLKPQRPTPPRDRNQLTKRHARRLTLVVSVRSSDRSLPTTEILDVCSAVLPQFIFPRCCCILPLTGGPGRDLGVGRKRAGCSVGERPRLARASARAGGQGAARVRHGHRRWRQTRRPGVRLGHVHGASSEHIATTLVRYGCRFRRFVLWRGCSSDAGCFRSLGAVAQPCLLPMPYTVSVGGFSH